VVDDLITDEDTSPAVLELLTTLLLLLDDGIEVDDGTLVDNDELTPLLLLPLATLLDDSPRPVDDDAEDVELLDNIIELDEGVAVDEVTVEDVLSLLLEIGIYTHGPPFGPL
jgi:hypothetical protein